MKINIDTKTQINEYRAPTDESVRLLKELEKEARDKVLKSYLFDDNEFKGTLIEVQDHCNLKTHYQYIFSLNGKEYQGKCSIREIDKMREKDIGKLIFERLSEAITLHLMMTLNGKRK